MIATFRWFRSDQRIHKILDNPQVNVSSWTRETKSKKLCHYPVRKPLVVVELPLPVVVVALSDEIQAEGDRLALIEVRHQALTVAIRRRRDRASIVKESVRMRA